MRVIWRSLKANLYKMVHIKLLRFHMVLPLLAVAVFNAYYMGIAKPENEEVELYLQVIAVTFPLMIAIVTTMVYESDLNAGRFQMLRMLPAHKACGHIGNLAALLLLGAVASMLAVVGFGVVYQGIGAGILEKDLGLRFYVNSAWLIFSVNIASYLIQYVVCYTFGKGISLGLGVIGTLLAPLMYLGLGDGICYWIPCSYGMRMISYYLLKAMPRQEVDTYIMMYVNQDFRTGTKVIIGITILAGALFCLWAGRWQGLGADSE